MYKEGREGVGVRWEIKLVKGVVKRSYLLCIQTALLVIESSAEDFKEGKSRMAMSAG